MHTPHPGNGNTPDTDLDPRRERSRARLLEAATQLLTTGGVHAVTVDAVTTLSRVARTTLYRNFGSSTGLLAATFERLLPRVDPPDDTAGLREQLLDLLTRQAALIDHAPVHLTVLAWLGLGPTDPGGPDLRTLRAQVVERYRQPYDHILDSPRARADLGDIDTTYAIAQLVGPVVFMRLTGIRALTSTDCHHIVDDFLTAHAR
ncbi:TetR/AcrR family transcriptional regulator [Nocardia asteroides]|uniref:TetR/AcrR family transcriptional regulator n=1 Tax=Nocardia asteroides TaxID=1824 RepID=UPI001E331CCF|nr:TetR/AcrR family transcriptional regulator [Nocardia asteroides]UGT58927.1 TetR/AcrR family transcriptional regulator [Nocardia asteroides]